MIALLLALATFCPGYHVRGMEYDICAHGPAPGLYVIDDASGYGYRVGLTTWLRSQTDLTWGDDERLGA